PGRPAELEHLVPEAVALGHDPDRLVLEGRLLDALSLRQRMPRRRVDEEGLAVEGPLLDLRRVERRRREPAVELVLAQALEQRFGLDLLDLELDERVASHEGREEEGEQGRREARDDAEAVS